MENIKAELQSRIDAKQRQLDALNITIEQAEAAAEEVNRVLRLLVDGDQDQASGILDTIPEEATRAHLLIKEISGMKETLNLSLIHAPERYVLTDGDLVCPSGFHPVQRVFIRNEVFINTSRLPENTNLKVFDLEVA